MSGITNGEPTSTRLHVLQNNMTDMPKDIFETKMAIPGAVVVGLRFALPNMERITRNCKIIAAKRDNCANET